VRAYGARLREALRGLFAVIHRRAELFARPLAAYLDEARRAVVRAGTQQAPQEKHCLNLAKRFEEHGDSYFRPVTTPGIEPTNNLAEQAIRFVVIDRLVTQETRSEVGDYWCERIWTVIATCAQQGQSVFEYLSAAVRAHFQGSAAPSLSATQGPGRDDQPLPSAGCKAPVGREAAQAKVDAATRHEGTRPPHAKAKGRRSATWKANAQALAQASPCAFPD
jgi:hypothetical protein